MEFFKAPEGWIYIHKEKGIENFGEVVVVTKDYPADDYYLISLEKFNELKAQQEVK